MTLSIAAAVIATLFVSAEPSEVLLKGSSNVAPWRCRGTSLEAEMTVAAPLQKINEIIDRVEDGKIGQWMLAQHEARFPLPQFSLRVPVTAFQCGNRRMEHDMRQALRAAEHPVIEFRLRSLHGDIRHDIDQGEYVIPVAGELSLAGARRDVVLTATIRRLTARRFQVEATLPLRMTSFEIKPPTALFGLVKANDELVVQFNMTLEAQP